MHGPYLFAGSPGSGKTTLAIKLAKEDCRSSLFPICFIDPEEVLGPDNFEPVDCAKVFTPRDALLAIYERGEHCIFVPENETDLDDFCKGIRAANGECILVFDEIGYYATSAKLPDNLARIIRTYRHLNVMVHMTTQYISDLSQLLFQCCEKLFVFRNQSPRAFKRLTEEFDIDVTGMATFPPGKYITWP